MNYTMFQFPLENKIDLLLIGHKLFKILVTKSSPTEIKLLTLSELIGSMIIFRAEGDYIFKASYGKIFHSPS